LPLLEGHDTSRVNLGLIENLRVEGGKLRGDVKFGPSARALEIAADVRDRIVRSLSVGYSIDDQDYDQNTGTVTATRWTPLEASVVSVPADTNAQFFRSRPMSDEDTGDAGTLSRSQRQAQRRTAAAELDAAESARNRASEIASLAQRHGMSDRTAGWLASGATVEAVREEILEAKGTRADSVIHASTNDGIGFRGERAARSPGSPIPLEELRKYSLIRAIRSQLDGVDRRMVREAGFELEVSRELADACDRAPKGLMVPDEIIFGNRALGARGMRGMTAGTGSAGGDLVATNLLAGEFIETLSNEPQVFALGARRLDGLVGNVAIPRMTAGSAVTWIGEGGDYGDTAPTFDQPTMTPHDLSARVDISRRLLIQSTPAADDIVRSDLALRIGIGIDAAAIDGSGSSNQPKGLLNVSGVGSVALGTNGAAPTWNSMTEVIEAVAAANGLRGNLGWLTNGSVMGTLMRTPLVTGFPRFIWEAGAAGARPDEGTIAGYKALVSNNVPSSLTKGSGSSLSALVFGNWADMIVGMWRGIDLLVDPYSQSSTGTVRITAIQTCDILVRHPASFCAIVDAITT
jgi:HK97 family phage major capsid protein